MCVWNRSEGGAVLSNEFWLFTGKAIMAKEKTVEKYGFHRDFCIQKDLCDFMPILV